MFAKTLDIASFDPELAKAIKGERLRQEAHVELIASENYASPRVLEAQGSVLTNKYAEGYPGKRYYGGCEYVDIAEQLAIERAKKLFGADYANVQPHSGSQANAAAYLALVQPGDPILGMSLDHGGHLTHVAGLVAAGIYPNPLPYADIVTTTTHKTLRGPRGGLILARTNEEITKKLNSLVFPGTQGGPLMHIIAAKAVALLEALEPEFKDYQRQVQKNARAMAARFAKKGYQIVSGGTDNHLFLMSLADRNITGKDADAALGRANITVNKNAVPNDPRPPMIASGLRIGTPAVTTRGFREPEVRQLPGWIADVLDSLGDESAVERARAEVVKICRRFP